MMPHSSIGNHRHAPRPFVGCPSTGSVPPHTAWPWSHCHVWLLSTVRDMLLIVAACLGISFRNEIWYDWPRAKLVVYDSARSWTPKIGSNKWDNLATNHQHKQRPLQTLGLDESKWLCRKWVPGYPPNMQLLWAWVFSHENVGGFPIIFRRTRIVGQIPGDWTILGYTVDGRNPAPPWIVETLWIME